MGEVQIFDAVNLHAKTMIPAHDSPLAALNFSLSGNELATASEKGTVIRVFSVSFYLKAAYGMNKLIDLEPIGSIFLNRKSG